MQTFIGTLTGVLAATVLGTGTPAAGTYVDGGTGAWTPLPTGGSSADTTAIDSLYALTRSTTKQEAPPVRDWPGVTRSVTADGAKGDGATNDAQALKAAVWAVGAAGGGTVTIPAGARVRVRLTSPGDRVGINHPNVTIRGLSDSSEIILEGSTPGTFVSLFGGGNESSNFHLEDLVLSRKAGTYGFFLTFAGGDGLTVDNVVLDGNSVGVPNPEFHGVQLGGNTTENVMRRLVFKRSTFKRFPGYAVVRQSTAKTSIEGLSFEDCRFDQNLMTDLELNAPNTDTPSAHFGDVVIDRCRFTNGLGKGTAAGWGVGFAGVYGARVTNNSFDTYEMQGVHVEDDSRDIVVSGNQFRNVSRVGSTFNSGVLILSGSHDVAVVGNDFDWSTNPKDIVDGRYDCVYVGPGGPFPSPWNVTVGGNTYRVAPQGTTFAVVNYGSGSVSTFGNSTRS